MEKRPFAEGSLRNAYYVYNLAEPDKKVFPIQAEVLFPQYVAKISKKSSHGREIYENDVNMQEFCQRWAEKFNACNPPKKVNYAKAWMLEFLDRDKSRYVIGSFSTTIFLVL